MTCPICTEEFGENDMYILPECDHMFHIDCIVSWFRMGNNRCPYCNNPGECNKNKDDLLGENNYGYNTFIGNSCLKERVNIVKKLVNRQDENGKLLYPELKSLFKKHDNMNSKLKELEKEKKNILNNEGTFKELRTNYNKIRARCWDIKNKFRTIQHTIASYPIKEVIVVKKKYIKDKIKNDD